MGRIVSPLPSHRTRSRSSHTRPKSSRGSRFLRCVRYLWASPNTLAAVAAGLLLGGRFTLVDGVVEIDSKGVAKALNAMPMPAQAMTVGHVVFGQDKFALRVTRKHERVHVSQYERWGPFFIPAYLSVSMWLFAKRRDGYRENPFEVEAYAVDTPDFRSAVREPGEEGP